MSILLSMVARQARLLALREVIDAGGGALRFYTLAAPATPESNTSETLLAVVTLATPGGAIGSSGALATLTLTVPRVYPVAVSGIAGWVRVVNGAGEGVMDMAVGLPGSGAAVIVTATQLYAGGELQLISCVLSE